MTNIEVLSLYLEGFAKIHTGMHIDKLYLDFKNMPNKTYLFLGDSGSGKSSILKSIHPFAFNSATGDESANSNLIMSNRDGKKIITYKLDKNVIVCKHLYLRKQDNGIQVKSFFSVDDNELNPSGLVSTFKELVYKYFYIDESFLTLLALGNSVKSMVEYTSSERKKLSVKIFNDLNIYMTYYKNASAVVKDLKSVLNNVIEKLDKYKDYDKKTLIVNINELNDIINDKQNDLDTILKNEGMITANLNANIDEYKKYEDSRGRITELFEQVEILKRKRKTTKDCFILENDKDSINRELIETEIRIKSLESAIESELNFKESKMKNKEDILNTLNRMENNINKTELDKLLANVDSELSNMIDIVINDDIDYNEKKEQLIKANIYLDELRSMSTDLVSEVEFHDLIPEVFKNFIKNKDFSKELDITYNAILERINNLKIVNELGSNIKIPKIVDGCTDKNCQYKKFYDNIVELVNTKKEKSHNILRTEEDKLKIVTQKTIILRILRKLYDYINNHTDILKFVPNEIFNPATFIDLFLSDTNREVYNRDLMGSSVTYLEQASRKIKLLKLKKTTEDQLNGINSTKELYNNLLGDLERIDFVISECTSSIENNQQNLKFNKDRLEEYKKSIKEIQNEIIISKELESVRKEIQDIQKDLASMEHLKQEHDELDRQIKILKDEEVKLRNDINSYRIKMNEFKNVLDAIKNLEKEKIVLGERYNQAVLIKDAVSPSKGIPVEFIDDVIRNQMIDSINELMHVAYPNITLLKDPKYLVINDREFTIPYKKNGVIVGDISEASDGERAMLSLAFSLVLIRLVSKVYNIMLLDEMDTSLDKYGRSKYIDIIEQYMETINAKQIFLISHNSMFDMYSVNVLQTTKGNTRIDDKSVIVQVYEQNWTPDEFQ